MSNLPPYGLGASVQVDNEQCTYAGVSTMPDGRVYAVYLLKASPKPRLSWEHANTWAETLFATLPTRAEAVLLMANCLNALGLHGDWPALWTCEEYGEKNAWALQLVTGTLEPENKLLEQVSRAVKRVFLT